MEDSFTEFTELTDYYTLPTPTSSTVSGLNTPTQSTRARSPDLITMLPKQNTSLTGFTYVDTIGRHVSLFYQNDQGNIYEATYLQDGDTGSGWKVEGIVFVGTGAKQNSPLAAVEWANGLRKWVFYLNHRNLICLRISLDGGQSWQAGAIDSLTIPTRNNSDLSATIECPEFNLFEIRVYYQDWKNNVRELVWKDSKWQEGDTPRDQALPGSPISALANGTERRVYSMAKTGNIQERYFRPDGAELNSPDQIEVFKEMPKFFKNVVVCWPRMHFGVFVHDGARVHQMNVKEEWNNEGIVGGVEKEVKEQFVALAWPRFDTDEDMGVHLFSMDGKNMRDYVVGKQPTVVVLTSADDLVNKSTDDCAF